MRNVKEIIAEMTLEEKAGLCSGATFWTTKAVERLGIPEVWVSDGPHGLRKQNLGEAAEGNVLGVEDTVTAVCFPAACAMAASFDTELAENVGRILGEECQAEDVSILLGPAVNIKRSPLCGRNFEYYSEDPYLTGEMAAAEIRGVQSWDVGTSMKHFAANNQEYNRFVVSAEVDERTLREIYLTGFEKAVKQAQPKTLMCSYNKINGVYSAENEHLLTEILRDEWGFEGYVMTDWGAVADRVNGIRAGLDLEMPSSGGVNDAKIVKAVKEGTLDETLVDRAVENILKVTYAWLDNRHPEAVFDREADHEKAVDVAVECAVLLENNGVLPISAEKKVVYIGEMAEKPRFQGGGSSHVNCSKVTSALDSATRKQREISYVKGFPADKDDMETTDIGAAVEAAKQADVVVVFAGLPDSIESEGADRTNMKMPACQDALIEAVCEVNKNVVVVMHNGSPVEMPWADRVAAVLEMYLGGQGVGEAADRLLYGEANPSGHLAESFPYRLEDNPSYINFPGDGRTVTYAEGIYVGYRYYEKKHLPVRYAFGHGLSYTTFTYNNLKTSADCLKDDDVIEVSVDVTNTGSLTGKEVVQLYISDPAGQSYRPVKELKGFCKVELAPGETKTVTMTVCARDLSYYNTKLGDWYAKSGSYSILIGAASDDIRLETEIQFSTEKQLPLVIGIETTIGDLSGNAKTVGIASDLIRMIFKNIMMISDEELLDKALNAILTETWTGDEMICGMSYDILAKMLDGMAIKSISSLGGASVDELIEQIEQALNS